MLVLRVVTRNIRFTIKKGGAIPNICHFFYTSKIGE